MGAAPAESFTDVITVELAKLNSDRPALTLLPGVPELPPELSAVPLLTAW
ncbi:hypothetical protein [Salinispora arenicola]|nr:hypothetical protein [Salinispora arenicola]